MVAILLMFPELLLWPEPLVLCSLPLGFSPFPDIKRTACKAFPLKIDFERKYWSN